MNSKVEQTLLARDVYSAWKRRVQTAKVSIRVFTPYLDRLLVRLIGNSGLNEAGLSVVTDLSPDSGARDYRNQLLGIRALLQEGIEVRSLARLHAKVLICDDRFVTVGSQNFTSYARRSKETTVVLDEDMSDSRFKGTLDEWYDSAALIELDFVEELLLALDEQFQIVRTAQLDLVNAFDALVATHEKQFEDDRRRRELAMQLPPIAGELDRALQRSRERQARTAVWARLQDFGEWDTYSSLVTDDGSDLTRWINRPPEGGASVTELNRLQFYPLVLNPTGRMTFARVGKSRITYVRDRVISTSSQLIGGHRYQVEVTFPEENLEESNVHLTIRPVTRLHKGLLLRARFDGIHTKISGWAPLGRQTTKTGGPDQQPHLGSAELIDLLSDPASVATLLEQAFAPFTYKTLGMDRRNAADFFPNGWLRVTLISYAEQHVLVASES